MNEISMIISVAGLFIIRIGVPVAILIIIGILIDRWQTRLDKDLREYVKHHSRSAL